MSNMTHTLHPLIAIPRGFEAEVLMGCMPFLAHGRVPLENK